MEQMRKFSEYEIDLALLGLIVMQLFGASGFLDYLNWYITREHYKELGRAYGKRAWEEKRMKNLRSLIPGGNYE